MIGILLVQVEDTPSGPRPPTGARMRARAWGGGGSRRHEIRGIGRRKARSGLGSHDWEIYF